MTDSRSVPRPSGPALECPNGICDRLQIAEWDVQTLINERDAAMAAATMRLKAALERYGSHQGDCKAGPEDLTVRCTCGYHAALVANGVAAQERASV